VGVLATPEKAARGAFGETRVSRDIKLSDTSSDRDDARARP